MSNKRLRQLFEASYSAHAQSLGWKLSEKNVRALRGKHGDYRDCEFMNGYWVGFQAAQAALQVTLPDPYKARTPHQYLLNTIDALEEACVKVAT